MKKTSRIIAVILLVMTTSLFASFDTKKGARSLAMGGAWTGMASGSDAFYHNPAGLWYYNHPYGETFFSRPFDLADLQSVTFNFLYPNDFGNFGMRLESFGFDLYREMTLGTSFSGTYDKKLAYGVAINYYHLSIKTGGSQATVGADVGLLFSPHKSLTFGFSSRNINNPKIAGDPLPQTFSAGLSYRLAEEWTVNADIYKDINFPMDIRFGLQYKLFEKFSARLGLSAEPSHFSSGIGWDFGVGELDYGFYTTPDLGVTHVFGTSFHIGRKNSRELTSLYRKR